MSDTYVPRMVGICAILGLSCLKLEFLKWEPIPELPESLCAKFSWILAHCWNFTLFPSFCHTFNYSCCYLKDTIMFRFSSRQFWRHAWVLSEKWCYESTDQIAQVFTTICSFGTSAKLIKYIRSVTWALVMQTIDFTCKFITFFVHSFYLYLSC